MQSISLPANVTAFALMAAVLMPWSAEACQPIPPEAADLLSGQLDRALRSGDAATLKSIYADDAIIITPATSRAQDTSRSVARHLRQLASGLRLTGEPTRTLRMGCNTIVSYGTAEFSGRRGGKTYRFSMRYSRVFERRDGHWRVTLDHMTPLETRDGSHAVAQRAAAAQGSSTELDALVRSISKPRPKPQVAGIVIRPYDNEASGTGNMTIPPQPRLAQRPEAVERRAEAPAKVARKRKSRRKSPDWITKIPGFGGSD